LPVVFPFFRHSARTEPTADFSTLNRPSRRSIAKREIHNVLLDYDTYDEDNIVCVDGSDGNSDKGVTERAECIEVSVDLPDISDDDIAEDLEGSEDDSDISPRDSGDDDSDDDYVVDDDDDDESDGDESDEISLPRPSRKRKRVGGLKKLFEWEDGDFEPEEITFDTTKVGIQKEYHALSNIIDFVKTFLCEELIELIVIESNRHYQQIVQSKKSPYSRLRHWRETNINEMYTFLAVYMLMVRNQKVSVSEYWSTDRLLCSPIFHEIISKNRFDLLMSMLHFCNSERQPEGDKLFKIAKVSSIIRQKFREAFLPFRNLRIGERLSFQGQNCNPKRRCIKMRLFVLCDVKTGYVLDFVVQNTALKSREEMELTNSVVITLMKPFLHQGHNLYIDNLYISPSLAHHLISMGTNVCGKVKESYKGLPRFRKVLQKGETESKHTGTVMALRWKGRWDVCMLTTFHNSEMKATRARHHKSNAPTMKPVCLVEYHNNTSTAAEHTDIRLSSLQCVRRSVKWYKKTFFHLMNLCLINAHALYQMHTGSYINMADFQLEATRQLLQVHHTPKLSPKGGKPSKGDNPIRLSERHFPCYVPDTPKGKPGLRNCFVCTHTTQRPRKRRESRYMCDKCDKGLCVTPCFRIYHTQVVF
jgi:hypothetical protein